MYARDEETRARGSLLAPYASLPVAAVRQIESVTSQRAEKVSVD